MMPMSAAPLLERLAAIVGPSGLVMGEELRGRSANWTRPSEPCAAMALVRPKDPREFAKRLRFHLAVRNARDYGL